MKMLLAIMLVPATILMTLAAVVFFIFVVEEVEEYKRKNGRV